jgi:hypothetical protein
MEAEEGIEIEPLFGIISDKLTVSPITKQTHKTMPCYHKAQIDSNLFSKTFLNRKPVLLKGFMNEEWQDWTPTALRDLFGTEILTVLTSRDNCNFIDNDLTCEKIQLEPRDLFHKIFEEQIDKRFYLRSLLPEALLRSIDQTSLQQLLDRGPNDRDNTSLMRVWIGTEGNITPLHYDRCHGILSQIYGTKKITLISPKYTQDIYPHDTHSSRAHCSRVNLLKWDEGDYQQTSMYPRFGRANRVEVVLEKGDILYTPPGWWHHVHSITASVSITVPFDMKKGESIPTNMII